MALQRESRTAKRGLEPLTAGPLLPTNYRRRREATAERTARRRHHAATGSLSFWRARCSALLTARTDAAKPLAEALTRELGRRVHPGIPEHPIDRWGRILVRRRSHTTSGGSEIAELSLRVVTLPVRRLPRRRLGSAPFDEFHATYSAVMELGEAVQTAIEHGLPLLLSSEASGELKDIVRVGRMKGRPGMLAITTADGPSATTRRVVAEQAIAELRELQRSGAAVTLDAGARQLVRMVRTRPLADDPVLLGRQRELAALKVVGSGVDASQTGTGKTITSGRALAHRAATTPRFRGHDRGRGPAARAVARRAAGRRARRAACRRSLPTSTCSCSPRTARSPAGSAASTASSATVPASRSWPTACSTATPESWPRSTGTC